MEEIRFVSLMSIANNIIYPDDAIKNGVDFFNKNGYSLGELKKEEFSKTVSDPVFEVVKVSYEDNAIYGEIKLLDNYKGNIIKDNIEEFIVIPRGMVNFDKSNLNETETVAKDLKIICFDLIHKNLTDVSGFIKKIQIEEEEQQ